MQSFRLKRIESIRSFLSSSISSTSFEKNNMAFFSSMRLAFRFNDSAIDLTFFNAIYTCFSYLKSFFSLFFPTCPPLTPPLPWSLYELSSTPEFSELGEGDSGHEFTGCTIGVKCGIGSATSDYSGGLLLSSILLCV